jgi:hypothetical protein
MATAIRHAGVTACIIKFKCSPQTNRSNGLGHVSPIEARELHSSKRRRTEKHQAVKQKATKKIRDVGAGCRFSPATS